MAKKPLRALILEDSEDDALLLVRELGQLGFDVEWERVWTAPAMQSQLEAGPWDVVLSDYSMPGFDAPAALQVLQETGPDLPFIVISGTIGEEAAVATMRSGAHDYLMKGNLTRLGAAIEREMREAGIRGEHRRAIDKIHHLNRVLRAIRNVNQLIVAEKDRRRLLERAAQMLVATRGYTSALCIHLDDDQQPDIVAHSAAAGQSTQASEDVIRAGGLTACMKLALETNGPVVLESNAPECSDCPLDSYYPNQKRLAKGLVHDGKALGVLAIALPRGIGADAEELDLLQEMTGDLAFALHDIDKTEQLAAETAMTEAAINAMQDTFFLFDPATGRALRWNASFRDISGYTDEEIAALPAPQSYYDGDDLLRAAAVTDVIAREGQAAVALDLITKTGEKVPFEYAATSVPGRKVGEVLIISVGRDISERRRAEEALRASEERYFTLFDNADELIQLVSPSGKFLAVNKKWTSVLGYSQEDAMGMKVTDVLRQDQIPHIAAMRQRAAAGEHVRVETVFVSSSGKEIDVDGSGAAMFKDGELIYTAGMFRDVTERKQMRAQIAQSDRLASMGMLAAGVAHEINNPLCYVLYNLQSLTDDLPRLSSAVRKGLGIVGERIGNEEWARLMGQDRELLNPSMLDDIRERFKDALHGTQRIKDIARGLGVFSRVERDRVVPVVLMHVIEVAINMVFNEIKYRARLVKEYGTTSTIMANDGRLSQVFLNLLINAAHAIPEGDVEGNEIRVRTWQEGDEVCTEVRDTGKGVASEHLPRLFEPFFTTKEIGTGTGLGLPISKTIVEEHGGRIEVQSEVGKGTSFVVRLPVKRAEEQEAAPGDQAPARPEVRGRILVVDDEAGIRAALVRMLKDHDVVEAASGQQAKETLEADQAFDLILCDMMMPAMSGVELHEWLEATHPDLARQVVFVTGGAFTPRAREYLARVSNIRLEKPFDVPNFKNIVSELIVASRTRGS